MDMNNMKSRGQQFLAGFTTGQKVMTGLAVVALIAGGYFFTQWASQPSYTVLFAGLSAQDAAKVTEKLSADGVPYKLSNGGTTVEVPQDKVYAERIALSADGTIGGDGSGAGWSLLDKQGITTSQFKQRVDYQRALAGELGKTISSLNGVKNATVTLQIPEQNSFVGTDSKPSASVLIATNGAVINGGQAKAIANLVAGSVEGLSPEDVTIADTNGVVLSTSGAAAADAASGAQASFESGLSQSLQDMLTAVVGPNRSVVRVAATMDFDQRASTTERLEPVAGAGGAAAPPVEQTQSSETFTGAPQNGQAAAQPDNYQKTSSSQTNAYTKVTEQLKQAPGAVTRMSVSVLLDGKTVPQEQVQNLTTALTAAAGIDPTRGDSINVSRIDFDETMAKDAKAAASAADSAKMMDSIFGYLRLFGALLLIGAVLFLIRRSMKKAAANRPVVKVPLDLPAIEGRAATGASASMAAAQLQGAKGLMSTEPRETASLEAEITNLIDRQPEEVAATLRSWLASGRG
jgi:flagellar M-ring protein FliF